MGLLTEAQQTEMRGYVEDYGTEVVTCIALSMLAENGYTGDTWAAVDAIEREMRGEVEAVGDGI